MNTPHALAIMSALQWLAFRRYNVVDSISSSACAVALVQQRWLAALAVLVICALISVTIENIVSRSGRKVSS